jgi:hypothetical protein
MTTQQQARHLMSLATALLDGLTSDTRALSKCVATLENLQNGRPSQWTVKNLSDCQRTIAELAARYLPNT